MADTIFEQATGLPLLPADEANERIVTLTVILREFVEGPVPLYFDSQGDGVCIYCDYGSRKVGCEHEPDCLWVRAKELLNA